MKLPIFDTCIQQSRHVALGPTRGNIVFQLFVVCDVSKKRSRSCKRKHDNKVVEMLFADNNKQHSCFFTGKHATILQTLSWKTLFS